MKGVTVYQNGLGIDDKLRSKNGTTVRYFLTDHLGSTEALTYANGAIVSSTSYDSFGNATPKQAAGSAASGAGSAASSTGKVAPNIATSYRYTGREYDSDTGLYYYRNRWYDPEIGRFISEDPIGFASGEINLYAYVHNNPLMFFDPLGMQKSHNSRRKSKKKTIPTVQKPTVQKPTKPNECGPSEYPTLERLVPDRTFSGVKLTPACNKHDICYATCGKFQRECDVKLGNDIYDVCRKGGGSIFECLGFSIMYHFSTHHGGGGSYESAQKKAGCTPCKDPMEIPLHLKGP